MTVPVYSPQGSKKGTVSVPAVFHTKVRADIIAKYFEADKMIQPYGPDKRAGRKHSASGTISHKRHDWKAHYGRGISRVPRKTMWRRGTQFYWIGAEISSARGGRRAHPPKGVGKEKKINKKEVKLAMNGAMAATAKSDFIVSRYATLNEFNHEGPFVMSSEITTAKTKEVMHALEKIFGEAFRLVRQQRSVRAGKGKLRGRKYKKNAGLLMVTGNDEDVKVNGITVKKLDEVTIADLYPLGRLTVYTEKAVEELRK